MKYKLGKFYITRCSIKFKMTICENKEKLAYQKEPLSRGPFSLLNICYKINSPGMISIKSANLLHFFSHNSQKLVCSTSQALIQ